jgi:hypothetical protein
MANGQRIILFLANCFKKAKWQPWGEMEATGCTKHFVSLL